MKSGILIITLLPAQIPVSAQNPLLKKEIPTPACGHFHNVTTYNAIPQNGMEKWMHSGLKKKQLEWKTTNTAATTGCNGITTGPDQ